MLYVGRVWLEYSDKEFWSLTPRQFASQLSVHEDIVSKMHGQKPRVGKSKPTDIGYIDQIPGW